jgi:hypothetical protein
MAKLKGYIKDEVFLSFQTRYKECIRMLNGLEKTFERKVSEKDRRWHIAEESKEYSINNRQSYIGYPV